MYKQVYKKEEKFYFLQYCATLIANRYDIRDRGMRRINQANKRCIKVWIILVLYLCAWQSLSAVIVLETPQTGVRVFVTDRIEQLNNTTSNSLLLPLCTISINAKHPGRGYLEITHTPLMSEGEEVPYQLFCDNIGSLIPDVLSYTCSPFIPLTISLTMLSAKLARPLQGARSSYSSMVFFHLKLEA